MSHYTQCPTCATVYAFTPACLSHSEGQARCGECGASFDAYLRVYPQLPPLPQAPAEAEPLWATPEPLPALANSFGELSPSPPATDAQLTPLPEHLEWLTEQWQPAPVQPLRWRLALLSLGLALLLVGQWVYVERTGLAQAQPALRPWLALACEWLACELPAPRDADAWRILNREVGPHPGQNEAWLAELSFFNDAPFGQPYPLVELTLLDARGSAVAGRRFTPAEYLPPSSSPAALAPPQQVIYTRLAFLAINPPASGFQFRFH